MAVSMRARQLLLLLSVSSRQTACLVHPSRLCMCSKPASTPLTHLSSLCDSFSLALAYNQITLPATVRPTCTQNSYDHETHTQSVQNETAVKRSHSFKSCVLRRRDNVVGGSKGLAQALDGVCNICHPRLLLGLRLHAYYQHLSAAELSVGLFRGNIGLFYGWYRALLWLV